MKISVQSWVLKMQFSDGSRVLKLTPGNNFTIDKHVLEGAHSGQRVPWVPRIEVKGIFRGITRYFLVVWPCLALGKLVTIRVPSSCGAEGAVPGGI